MKIEYHLRGIARKRLAIHVGEFARTGVCYRGSPGYEYDIGIYSVDQEGALVIPDGMNHQRLLTYLSGLGYTSNETNASPSYTTLAKGTVTYPRSDFSSQDLDNLRQLVGSKAVLIMKSLGVDALPIEVSKDIVMFPWLPETVDGKTAKAVDHLIRAMCDMAHTQKTIRAVERPIDNDKYAFRCFLLRLGFIGEKYQEERKTLLARLLGLAAFREEKK